MDKLLRNTAGIYFVIISTFALSRPIFTLNVFNKNNISGISWLELYGIIFSYIFIVVTLFSINKINIIDIDIAIISFVLYVLLSFYFADDYKGGIRIVLPFAVFFATRHIVTNEAQICKLSRLTILGYVVPIIGSLLYILMGKSESTFIIFQTGLKRYSGLYFLVHAFAHSMLVYIFIFMIYLNTSEGNVKKSKLFVAFGYFLAFLAIINIYKSGTRTVMIGFIIFLIAYLFGKKLYYVLSAVGTAIIISIFKMKNIQYLLFDIIEPIQGQGKIEKLGSGRYGLWEGELASFFSQPFEVQMIGKGLGHSASEIYGKTTFGSSHNDFIAVLVSLGYIGLLLYVAILLILFRSIIVSKIGRIKKYIFIGVFVSVFFMNIFSNSYISRFDLAQYFSFIFALYYSYNSYVKNNMDMGRLKEF